MWIWRGSYLRVGRVYLLSLAAVERCKQLLPTFLSLSSSLPALFDRETHRFLIIPPPCAIVRGGQSATEPTPALSARNIPPISE